MESSLLNRNHRRVKRAGRVRKAIHGTSDRPRFSVSKTNRHIGVQLIDDEKGVTLLAVHTQMKKFRSKDLHCNKHTARLIGLEIGKLAVEKQINKVVFDRGFYKFHGVMAELASAAREAGLQF